MTGQRWRVLLLMAAVVSLTGGQCATLGGAWPPKWPPWETTGGEPPPREDLPLSGRSDTGKLKVYGASLYSDGQQIFKQLRQQDTLNAFLVCQGEPDFVEVAPGGADRITLTYSRGSAHERGTVQIVRSSEGYYVAQPIKPPESAQQRPPPPPPPPPPLDEDPDRDGLDERQERTAGTDPQSADTDADGLSDGDEVRIYQTDPRSPDSDADGLSDGDEVRIYQTDPRSPDSDADGLSDGDEVHVHKTDPSHSDSDADGLSDGEEVQVHATNPLALDTDVDGLSDGFEVANGFNPSAGGEQILDPDGDGLDNLAEETARTNPNAADTDGDGSNDRCEVSVGTDPNNATSAPPPLPQPSATQRDDCPIEPWRSDCREFCSECAEWEWCGAAP